MHTGKGNFDEESNTNAWRNQVTTTGKIIDYAKKNIYDLAGNVYEWTMEAYNSNFRVVRGNGYKGDGSSGSASYRGKIMPESSTDDSLGFRVALYL